MFPHARIAWKLFFSFSLVEINFQSRRCQNDYEILHGFSFFSRLSGLVTSGPRMKTSCLLRGTSVGNLLDLLDHLFCGQKKRKKPRGNVDQRKPRCARLLSTQVCRLTLRFCSHFVRANNFNVKLIVASFQHYRTRQLLLLF